MGHKVTPSGQFMHQAKLSFLDLQEKEIQLVDQEVQQLKQEVKTLDHGNLEMMKVVKEYEKAISEVIADRERERVCHDIEKEKVVYNSVWIVSG